MPIDIIKAHGRRSSEPFQPKKLHNSIVAICLSARAPVGEAERIATRVTEAVLVWSGKKPEATSGDIRLQAAGHLEKLHGAAGHLYRHHRQIL